MCSSNLELGQLQQRGFRRAHVNPKQPAHGIHRLQTLLHESLQLLLKIVPPIDNNPTNRYQEKDQRKPKEERNRLRSPFSSTATLMAQDQMHS